LAIGEKSIGQGRRNAWPDLRLPLRAWVGQSVLRREIFILPAHSAEPVQGLRISARTSIGNENREIYLEGEADGERERRGPICIPEHGGEGRSRGGTGECRPYLSRWAGGKGQGRRVPNGPGTGRRIRYGITEQAWRALSLGVAFHLRNWHIWAVR